MEKEIFQKLMELARLLKLKKINDKYYQGQYGTIFRITSFGFEVASITAEDYPENYTTCEDY